MGGKPLWRNLATVSPFARQVYENITERTLPAGARFEIPRISSELTPVHPSLAGRAGTVIGDTPEVVWDSGGWGILAAREILHQVLLDGESETLTLSDQWMVRSDVPAPSAKQRWDRLPDQFRERGPFKPGHPDDPRARDAYHEIRSRRWAPGRRFVLVGAQPFAGSGDGEGVVTAGQVEVTWCGQVPGFEVPDEVLHPVLFDGADEPVMLSDRRMGFRAARSAS